MRRPSRFLVILLLSVAVAGCGEPPPSAPLDIQLRPDPPVPLTAAEPGCLFRFHAKLAPEGIPDAGPEPEIAGQIHFRLEGQGEEDGEMEYRGGLPFPEIDWSSFERILVKVAERIPRQTPEWTDHQKSQGGRILGSRLRFGGGAPIDPALAAALARSPSDFLVRLEVEGGQGTASFDGILEPGRGSSGDVREESIGSCFSG